MTFEQPAAQRPLTRPFTDFVAELGRIEKCWDGNSMS